MKVFVYFNLHKKCWSVKAMEGDQKGLVIMHANTLSLERAAFKVSEAGRQRVLAEKRKNVHAGVVGHIVESLDTADCITPVSYNPYKAGYFFNKNTDEPVHYASKAFLHEKKVFIS